ncbi:DUF2267 domain-containing protein [Nonomuraea sp. NPDC046802]|uniref:DUF2267 domain-containing protein n=1 Tax=Nonomuraea sp. NPDC046802 TaxID=3154919 RepID=UPI0033C0A105
MRGVHYDGWRPSTVPVKADREEFLHRVCGELAFGLQESEEDLVKKVLQALKRHITDGEWEDVKAGLPKDLASILP